MIYGYCRVSTSDQNTKLQVESLKKYGVEEENIFEDVISGSTKNRPNFDKLISKLEKGDTIVCWKLDRLGRSVKNLSTFLEDMNEREVVIKSVMDGLDTSSKSSKMLFHLLSVVSEMEKDNINERIKEGIKNSKIYGTKSGNKHGHPCVSSPKIQLCMDLISSGESIKMTSRKTGVSERTIYRRLKEIRQNGSFTRQKTIFEEISQSKKV